MGKNAYRILIIEDEEALCDGLAMNLEAEGFDVFTAGDGKEGLELVQSDSPDLITLDMMLPGKIDGLEVCREIRRRGLEIPIVILSCRSEESRIVSALEIGADDYVTKPFHLQELIARIHVHLRRQRHDKRSESDVFRIADIEVNFKQFRVFKGGNEVEVTSKEFNLLQFLIKRRGELLTRDEILNEVWGYEAYPTTRTVDNHILRLRKKLEDDPSRPRMIHSVYGEGYRFVEA